MIWTTQTLLAVSRSEMSGRPSRRNSLELRVQVAASQYGLTKREAEVLLALVQGRSKGYVADILMISRETVRTHTQHVYQKLGVHSREELMSKMLDE